MQHSISPSPTYPVTERNLFEGRFAAQVRELFRGSSRADALAAIRRAPLEGWELSNDKTQVELHAGPTHLRIISGGGAQESWIEASTPHGKFSLPGSHWVSQQILRRLERRFEGYRLALRAEAQAALSELSERVLAGGPQEWRRGASAGFCLRELAMSRQAYYCDTGRGFVVGVGREIFAGEISPETAYRDHERFENEMRYHQQRRSEGTYTPLGYIPNYEPLPWVTPPLCAGPYRYDGVHVAVCHEHLSMVAKILGLSEKDIIKTETPLGKDRASDALWKQARGSHVR